MTSAVMITRLKNRSGQRWTSAQCLVFLNDAQDRLIEKLNHLYFTEITEIDTLTLTGKTGLLSALSPDIYDDSSVIAMRYEDGDTPFYTEIPFSRIKDTENTLLAPTNEDPMYYVYAGSIYAKQPASAPDVTVFYIREPLVITAAVNTELDSSLHELLVTIAESFGWVMDNRGGRAALAVKSYTREIEMMNGRQL